MKTIKQLRQQIEKIDTAIIKKLAQRKKITLQIGKLKQRSAQSIKDMQREHTLLRLYVRLCDQYQLEPLFVKRLFKIIIGNSRELQRRKR